MSSSTLGSSEPDRNRSTGIEVVIADDEKSWWEWAWELIQSVLRLFTGHRAEAMEASLRRTGSTLV